MSCGGSCPREEDASRSPTANAIKIELVRLVEDVVGHAWQWRRPHDRAFSLESGRARLAGAFDQIQRIDCPSTVVEVTDPNALAAYLTSIADHHEGEVADWTTWQDVVVECTNRVAAEVRRHGWFRISTSVGAFVCR